jgi:hypothetical protein
MSFSCKNYQYADDSCAKVKSDCIPGRPGCVLEGKVKLSEELEKRLQGLAEERQERRRKR